VIALLYLAAAVISAALAWRALRRAPQDPAHRAFARLGLILALCWAGFLGYLVDPGPAARGLHAAAALLLPAALTAFFNAQAGVHPRHALARPSTLAAIGLACAAAFTLADGAGSGRPGEVSAPEVLAALAGIAGLAHGLVLVWRHRGALPPGVQRARWGWTVGLLGAAVAAAGLELLGRAVGPLAPLDEGPLARLHAIQGPVPPLSPLLATLTLALLQHGLRLRRLLDLHEILARVATLVAAGLLLAIFFGLLRLDAPSTALGTLHRPFLVFLLSCLFLLLYDPLRERLATAARHRLNDAGERLDASLEEVRRRLPRVLAVDDLHHALLQPLFASGRVPRVALYLPDTGDGHLRLRLHLGDAPAADLPRDLLDDPPVSPTDAPDPDLLLPARHDGALLGAVLLTGAAEVEGFSEDERRRLARVVDRVGVLLGTLGDLERMRDQHRLAALGEMAAGLAHEIRNPLASIKGAAQYLQTAPSPSDPAEVQEFLGLITSEVDRLGGVVGQFLDYARPLVIHAEDLSPGAFTVKVAEQVRIGGGAGVPVRVDVDPALGEQPLCADAGKLRQVLLNLIQNALQAMQGAPVGGEVCVRVAPGPAAGGGPTVDFHVTDSGPGFGPEVAAKLFIPFFTTRPDGSGLGLAVSRRIAEAHGGELFAESIPGAGARFTLRLPRSRAQAVPSPLA
jgi:signal transduction histidine kinase